MDGTCNSGESSQDWPFSQNFLKGTAKTHPGSHRRSQKNPLGQCSLLHNKKKTGQK
uniref:Uncharacterized protein n=1 Tax=Anguilla anguilla TaxID=7936 RepID=A0A0E9WKR9_ANGAN